VYGSANHRVPNVTYETADNRTRHLNVAPWPARIATLVRRERKTRFSGGRLGALWAFITPVSWIAFVVLFYRLTGRTAPIDAGLEVFVAVGFLPYIVFRQTITTMTRGTIANRAMLVIRGVRVSDLLAASALQELINAFSVMAIVLGGITLFFDAPLPANPGLAFLGVGGAWMLGVGLGRVFSVLAMMSDTMMRAIPIILRPTFWISGIFYTSHELFGPVHDVLAWSPLLHTTEILREGYFLGFHSTLADPMFVLVFALVPYVLSFLLEEILVRRDVARYRA
jgi:capsular polysaccharide transport system permease protein